MLKVMVKLWQDMYLGYFVIFVTGLLISYIACFLCDIYSFCSCKFIHCIIFCALTSWAIKI
jgi:hypothetical protein